MITNSQRLQAIFIFIWFFHFFTLEIIIKVNNYIITDWYKVCRAREEWNNSHSRSWSQDEMVMKWILSRKLDLHLSSAQRLYGFNIHLGGFGTDSSLLWAPVLKTDWVKHLLEYYIGLCMGWVGISFCICCPDAWTSFCPAASCRFPARWAGQLDSPRS